MLSRNRTKKETEIYQEKQASLDLLVHQVLQGQAPPISKREVTFFTWTIKEDLQAQDCLTLPEEAVQFHSAKTLHLSSVSTPGSGSALTCTLCDKRDMSNERGASH
ncbi:uncharacterized protein V6R79_005886 [Siganus canaliculatus]